MNGMGDELQRLGAEYVGASAELEDRSTELTEVRRTKLFLKSGQSHSNDLLNSMGKPLDFCV